MQFQRNINSINSIPYLLVFVLCWGLCLSWIAPKASAQDSLIRVMPPLGAGPFYPADPEKLFEVVKGYLEEASTPAREERLVATIVPHGGYGLSGDIAAHAFKHLRQGEYERVMVLGAPHFSTFEGCSIPALYGYQTPLGVVQVNLHAVEQLTRSPLISARSVRKKSANWRSDLHEVEFSIEMVLPFLQMTLHDFEVIPIMVGDLRDAARNYNENIVEAVAEGISRELDEDTLLVVSTDFTHFGNDYSYRPFNTHILDRIFTIDHDIIDRVMALDTNGIQEIVERTEVPICGLSALQVLTKLLPRNVRSELLAYSTSGEQTGQEDRSSVSYAAINFYEGPERTSQQEEADPIVLRKTPEEEVVEGAPPKRREGIVLTLPPGGRKATAEDEAEENTSTEMEPPSPEEVNSDEE